MRRISGKNPLSCLHDRFKLFFFTFFLLGFGFGDRAINYSLLLLIILGHMSTKHRSRATKKVSRLHFWALKFQDSKFQFVVQMVHFITGSGRLFLHAYYTEQMSSRKKSVLDHESRALPFFISFCFSLLRFASRLAGDVSFWKEQKKMFHISAKDSRFSLHAVGGANVKKTLLIALLVLNTRQLEIY